MFTQYDQQPDGTRVRLEHPNIDTGMGLERIAAVCQGKKSNFDSDLFQDIIQYAAKLANVTYSFSEPDTNDVDTALRVIADHSRAAAFLITDGTLPSNEGRGYVLRRLIRRALRFATLMGVNEPILYKIVGKVIETMGDDYPELKENAEFIARVVHQEEVRFSSTLAKGLRLLEGEIEELKAKGEKTIPGEVCFQLADTYGFPLDIVSDVAFKQGYSVDEEGFAKLMAAQRARAKESLKKGGLLGQGADDGKSVFVRLAEDGIESRFVGYDTLSAEGRVVALLDEAGMSMPSIEAGQKGYVVTNVTPFYGEGGGQTGDRGSMLDEEEGMEAEVLDTLKPQPTLYVHVVEVKKGRLSLDREVLLKVNKERRLATARNHSSTHLLHAALRKVLGTHVHQKGSLVTPDRLRFDFSHIAAMTPEELALVEQEVNKAIMADMPVTTKVMAHDEAVESGAIHLFEEKYGDSVRVVSMGDEDGEFSKELCGGTHLSRTGQAGQFLIVGESGVAAGVRRIEAVTGFAALELVASQRGVVERLSHALKTKPEQIEERLEALQAKVKKLEKASEKAQAAPLSAQDIVNAAEMVNGISFMSAELKNINVKAMRSLMDDIRSRVTGPAVCALFGGEADKVSIIVFVSKEAQAGHDAPAVIREISPLLGGKGGGGRPDMAQAGGTDFSGVTNAIAKIKELLLG